MGLALIAVIFGPLFGMDVDLPGNLILLVKIGGGPPDPDPQCMHIRLKQRQTCEEEDTEEHNLTCKLSEPNNWKDESNS